MDFSYIVKQRKSKMLFHFFLNFSFVFSFIAAVYIPGIGSSTAVACLNNCTATYSETYQCIDPAGSFCEDLSNPRENVALGAQTTLSNIPCRFTTVVRNGCPP